MDVAEKLDSVSLSEKAYLIIRRKLLIGSVPHGTKLNEVDLASQLGISRSPIREALQRLMHEGLLQQIPRRGVFVRQFTSQEIIELSEVREALEVQAVRLAARRASDEALEQLQSTLRAAEKRLANGEEGYPTDEDFHMSLFRLAANRQLTDLAVSIHTQLRLARSLSGAKPARAKEALKEHLAIFSCVSERNEEKAVHTMQQHISHATENMIGVVNGNKEPICDKRGAE